MEPILVKTLQNLKKNRFNAFYARDASEAKNLALQLIEDRATVGLGGSMSVDQIGLREALIDAEKKRRITFYNPYREGITREESLSMRRKGMEADFFVTGTNAVTQQGELLNVDGYGNRVAAQIYGPKKVIIIVGSNKICKTLDEARARIREVAAPLNAKRLGKKTPCVKAGRCMDCESEERICNYTTIIQRSHEPGRISVIIVDESLGL
jgi:L-lactate utilization protein LutB